MNKLTDKTMGDVVIVRRPHRFKPTVTWFGSKEDAYRAYDLWNHIADYKNLKDFAEAIGDEDAARRELEGSGIGDNEPFCEITDFPNCGCPVEYVKELNLDEMLDEAVSYDMHSGTVFVAEDGETWGEFAERIYENTRGHNEPSMTMIRDALYLEAPSISMDNGLSYQRVDELSDQEVDDVVDQLGVLGRNSETIRAACDAAMGDDNREWLASFLENYDNDLCFG